MDVARSAPRGVHYHANVAAFDVDVQFLYLLIMYCTVGIRFALGTAPSHVSIPQIRMARRPKADK